jgi:hypothetical protein
MVEDEFGHPAIEDVLLLIAEGLLEKGAPGGQVWHSGNIQEYKRSIESMVMDVSLDSEYNLETKELREKIDQIPVVINGRDMTLGNI